MLGNGFDVSFGIESSYSSFYKWYCPQKSTLTHVNEFRKTIDDEIKSDIPDEDKMWSDFEIGLGKYTDKFSQETVSEFLDCLVDAQENIQKYLLDQLLKFDIDVFSNEDFGLFSNSLLNFYDEVTDTEKNSVNNLLKNYQNQNRRISFITFNYTNTLEKILSKIPDSPLNSWRYGSTSY